MNVRDKILIIATMILASCSGYHFKKVDNPFGDFEIKTLQIPMFINRSIFPSLNSYLTQEITNVLGLYPGLKIVGPNTDSDAVLIGIIESKRNTGLAIRPNGTDPTAGELKATMGKNRQDFYYNTNSILYFKLRLILIKNPTANELAFFTGPVVDEAGIKLIHPKIIFNQVLSGEEGFARENKPIYLSDLKNSSGDINFVKTLGNMEAGLRGATQAVGESFRQVILHVF